MRSEVATVEAMAARPKARVFHRLNTGDRAFAGILFGLGGLVVLLAAAMTLVLWRTAYPAIARVGWAQFVRGTDWDPVQDSFGALPFIYGTLVTSFVSVVLATPVAVGLSLFLTEMASARWRPIVTFPLELLAAIPSVVYGLWGLFTLVPLMRDHVEPWLQRVLGFLPLFQGPPIGLGYLTAGVLLAIMILPTIASVSIEVLRSVPTSMREAAYGLGATRWEAIRLAAIPHATAGIFGAVLLGLGRALGETMAVTMVIGNAPEIHASLFAPGYSLPAVIANEFAEASGTLHTGALAALALVLFAITFLLNAGARLLVRTTRRKAGPR